MPYCPLCNREYGARRVRCPECKELLVDGFAVASALRALDTGLSRDAEPEFAVICETDSPVVLSRAKAILEAEGISCVTRWPLLTQPFSIVGELVYDAPPWPRVNQLVVRAEDVARAREVLDLLEPIPDSASDGGDEDVWGRK